MTNKIIEILEIGFPQSIIQRENDPITQLIYTPFLLEEVNKELLNRNNLSAKQFAEFVSDIMIKNYGEHNYEDFKKLINKRLKQ